jgi:hypothetical protein
VKPRRWMPLSSRSFALMTSGMSAEEVGAFCMIWGFLAQQKDGKYVLGERGLAITARVSLRRWRTIAPRVARFFVIDGDTVSLPAKRQGYRSLPTATKKFVFGRDGNKCRYCGSTDSKFHIDHIIPRSRGGSDDPTNLCVACEPCNCSKNDSTPEEWVQ